MTYIQKLPQPLFLLPALVFDIIAVLRSTNHSCNGNAYDGGQRMGNIGGMAMNGHSGKVLHQGLSIQLILNNKFTPNSQPLNQKTSYASALPPCYP
jgi:hypothetical protein